MDTNTNVTTHTTLTLTNAENLAIIEDRSVTQQAQDQQQDEVNYEEPIYVIQDGGRPTLFFFFFLFNTMQLKSFYGPCFDFIFPFF